MRHKELPTTCAPSLQQSLLDDPQNDLDEVVYQRFVDVLGGKETGLAYELVAEFLHDIPDQLAILYQALRSNREAACFQILHTLKTSSSAMGAWYLAALCQEMEKVAYNDGLECTVVRFRQIEKAFERVRFVLQRKLAE